MDKVDQAWAAGLFDGEGTILLQREPRTGHENGSLEIRVSITEQEVVDTLQTLWGGKVRTYERVSPTGSSWRPVYVWALYSVRAAAFLGDIFSFCRSRHSPDRIELALEYQDLKDGYMQKRNQYRPATAEGTQRNERMAGIRERMNAHNKRGKAREWRK